MRALPRGGNSLAAQQRGRGLRLPRGSDVLAASDAADKGADKGAGGIGNLPASGNELALMRAVAAAAAGQGTAPNAPALCGAVRLWQAVRTGEDRAYGAAITLPALPGPLASPPPGGDAMPPAYAAEEDGQAASAGRAAAAAWRALVAVHDAVVGEEAPPPPDSWQAQVLDATANLAAKAAAGEGARVRGLGSSVLHCGAPVRGGGGGGGGGPQALCALALGAFVQFTGPLVQALKRDDFPIDMLHDGIAESARARWPPPRYLERWPRARWPPARAIWSAGRGRAAPPPRYLERWPRARWPGVPPPLRNWLARSLAAAPTFHSTDVSLRRYR